MKKKDLKCCGNCMCYEDETFCTMIGNDIKSFECCEKWKYDCVSRKERLGK